MAEVPVQVEGTIAVVGEQLILISWGLGIRSLRAPSHPSLALVGKSTTLVTGEGQQLGTEVPAY